MARYWNPKDGNGSWGAGGKAGFSLLSGYIRPEVRATWLEDVADGRDGKVNAVPVEGGAVISFLPTRRINPFITTGVGYVFMDSQNKDDQGNVGAYAGGGVDVSLVENFNFFYEVLYRFV